MSYNRITWLPDVLRAAGINVVLHKGWKTRGLSTAQRFEPRAFTWHHDASARGSSPAVPQAMIDRFATAAAQCWVCLGCKGAHPVGTWHIIASGRAPHAGAVLPGMPGNPDSVGVETDHTTGEAWHPDLLASLRKGTAAALAHMHISADRGLHFHKTVCSPPGRKPDPDGLDLKTERARVAELIVTRDGRPAVSLRRVVKAARRAKWSGIALGKPARRDRALVRAALRAQGCATYRDWQRALGNPNPDGIPAMASLVALGKRAGFRVVA